MQSVPNPQPNPGTGKAVAPDVADLFASQGSAMPTSEDDIVLPNAREVNRAERARRQAEKAQTASRKSGEGIFKRTLDAVCKKHAGDPLKQVAAFLGQVQIPSGTGGKRTIGELTLSHYGNVLGQSIGELYSARMPIQNLSEFGQKHMLALIRLWLKRQDTIDTIKWRVSIWRRTLTLTGKPKAIPSGRPWSEILRQNGLSGANVSRATIPDLPKGWRDLGVDPKPLIDAIREEEPVVGAQLDMMLAFGLRVNESVQIEPADSDAGVHLSVHRGTKGGKRRKVKFSDDPEKAEWQRRVLANAKSLAAKHPRRRLAIRGLTLKQMKERQRYLVRKHGASKSVLGITPHGLRHQFGTDLFKDLTGMPAPVLGLLPKAAYDARVEDVRNAYLEISRQMGHERPSISSAYVSTPTHVGKLEIKRLHTWLTQLGDGAGEAFRTAGATEAWLVGSCADGLPVMQDDAMQIAVRFGDVDLTLAALAERIGELRKVIEQTVNLNVSVTCWAEAHRPVDGAEINF